ncbi:PD-(D/E)XK nuclease family protein [Natrinema hispanicum]|uniref:PD-(D/E)XK nuclease superfamily protein n=2 Tax=Natrinema hispanicum TaxID=392421 RepID=A0A1I0HM42_9EURY|nr:PD-(D/E)XK nuclease family protein [Natrinema hispanicum]SET85117.1 PD-(D/E)XK nuclease superfamily protein [Natrinema hispanicum]
MIHELSTLLKNPPDGIGEEMMIRCRVRSDAMPGEAGGEKIVYLVDDPVEREAGVAALSFWADSPSPDGIRATDSSLLSTLDILVSNDINEGLEGMGLRQDEELIVRAVPNYRPGEGEADLYLNVTSVVIRSPETLVSKAKLRVQERCSREYYLRYVKNAYTGGRYNRENYQRSSIFRGNAVHEIAEKAFEEHLDRFLNDEWTPESVETYCTEFLDDGLGFEQALLVLSGAGLDERDHIVEITTRLFTDEELRDRLTEADSVEVEWFLDQDLGFAGQVDLLLDETPYDIKTTRNPNDETIDKHSYQLKLYLTSLLFENLENGQSVRKVIAEGQTAYLIYPNVDAEDVRFVPVELTWSDVIEFLQVRNDATKSAESFAPPSTYNRDCEDCAFASEEWINGPNDALPPACTYHCQNERRWPCYEFEDGSVTSDCSLFDRCEQRHEYRTPATIDRYESTRAAFNDEKRARNSARRALERLDRSVQRDTGYLLDELTLSGMASSGAVVLFEAREPTVPAFSPGSTVRLRTRTESVDQEAIYLGQRSDTHRFKLVSGSARAFLSEDGPFEALYAFSTRSITHRYLPYLDFAQRRGVSLGIQGGNTTTSTATRDIVPERVTDYLDTEEVFIDLPIGTDRRAKLERLVREILTASLPHPNNEGENVPDAARRVLVLGTTPKMVDIAADAQPEGAHYRVDGMTGSDEHHALRDIDGYHELQQRLLESNSLVSSVEAATSENGPGGVGQFFHRLEEGSFGARDHSDKFFDHLVVLGAEALTEPEYRFLADVADRAALVGDTRASGPSMVSRSARDADLEVSYFEQAFEHYSSFESETAVSLQMSGSAPPALRQLYPSGPWDDIEGQIRFLNIEGGEASAVEAIELHATVRAENGPGRRLVFDVTDTPIDPLEAQEIFTDRHNLDVTSLREESIVVINEESFYLARKGQIDGDNPEYHEVSIRADALELSQFSSALLRNRIAEQIVTQVASAEDIDLIVTPFAAHANAIERRLADENVDATVSLPENLDGDVADRAIVSFGTANDARIVRPPLDDPEVLYRLFSCAKDVVLVGNGETLQTKDLFQRLIAEATPYANTGN